MLSQSKSSFRYSLGCKLTFHLFLFRFQESSESLQRCGEGNGGKDILVPLTGSMYVPGKLSDTEKVVVEIGTGYYVEKVWVH